MTLPVVIVHSGGDEIINVCVDCWWNDSDWGR